MRYATLLMVFVVGLAGSATATSPTGWSPVVLPTGQYRVHVKSMPIQHRPGRLLHVYGNTVRLINQSDQGMAPRPLRQIVLGTTDLRTDRSRRN